MTLKDNNTEIIVLGDLVVFVWDCRNILTSSPWYKPKYSDIAGTPAKFLIRWANWICWCQSTYFNYF